MHPKTINFILVLITGRVWSEKDVKSMGNKSIDFWDYDYGVEFLISYFYPQIKGKPLPSSRFMGSCIRSPSKSKNNEFIPYLSSTMRKLI